MERKLGWNSCPLGSCTTTRADSWVEWVSLFVSKCLCSTLRQICITWVLTGKGPLRWPLTNLAIAILLTWIAMQESFSTKTWIQRSLQSPSSGSSIPRLRGDCFRCLLMRLTGNALALVSHSHASSSDCRETLHAARTAIKILPRPMFRWSFGFKFFRGMSGILWQSHQWRPTVSSDISPRNPIKSIKSAKPSPGITVYSINYSITPV